MPPRCLAALACFLLSLSVFPPAADAAEEPARDFLSMYFSEEELEVFSATRSLTSVARVAENVAVVTAEDIERTGAHTVAEALYNVTGVEITEFRGPASSGTASIQGSGRDRTTVLLDGVPLQSPNNDFQLAVLPAQMIRRIEVIKGPASATWGSSFGGVVNVITKSAGRGGGVSGTASVSIGEGETSDARAEVYLRRERFGAYLFGGRLASDGLPGGEEFTHGDVFAKVSTDVGARSRLDLTAYAHDSDSVNGDFRARGVDALNGFTMRTLHGKADLGTPVGDGVDLSVSAWWLRQDDNFYEKQASTGAEIRDGSTLFERRGLGATLTAQAGAHALVAGAEASEQSFSFGSGTRDGVDRSTTALFVNDTIVLGRLSVAPGLRYDRSSISGEMLSPRLGATWLASRDLLLRALVSRGFHDPSIVMHLDAPQFRYFASPGLTSERIWSYQAGLEANVADLLRAKLTLFHHDVDDILIDHALDVPDTRTTVNGGRARSTGGEIELETNSWRGLVLRWGLHHERVRLLNFSDLGTPGIRDVTGVNAALDYDGQGGLRVALRAHYLAWETTELWQARDRGVVVDCTVAHPVPAPGRTRLVLFAAGRNLFNAKSYVDPALPNPGRWFEAGVRCSF